MGKRILNVLRGLAIMTIVLAWVPAQAQMNPGHFNFDGALVDPGTSNPMSGSPNIKLQVMDKNATCVLYQEIHTPTLDANGAFSIRVGVGSSGANFMAGGSVPNWPILLANKGAVAPFSGCSGGVTLAAGDTRMLRVMVDNGGGYVTLTPDFDMGAVPFASTADSIQGKLPGDFIQMKDDSTFDLNQANVESIFSTTNLPKLLALLSGTSNQYLTNTSAGLSNQRLPNIGTPVQGGDAANKNYVDTRLGNMNLDVTGVGAGVGDGKSIIWDQAANKWVTGTASGVNTIAVGSGLTGGGSGTAVSIGIDVGVSANQIVRLNGSAQLPGVSGQLLSNINAIKLQARPVSPATPTTNQVLAWDGSQWAPTTPSGGGSGDIDGIMVGAGLIGGGTIGTASIGIDVGTTANQIVQLNGSAQLPAVSGQLLSNINAVKLQTRPVSSTTPTTNQVLAWDGSQWTPTTPSGGGITGLTGDVIATGTGNVNATIVNNSIDSYKIKTTGIAVNRLLITDASTGTTVDYMTCANNEILKYTTATGWGCSTVNALTTFPVNSVAGRTGAITLTDADISGLGTASVKDYGTAANNLVELNGAGALPVLDGGLLGNVNAAKIAGRTVASTPPTAGQVLMWNTIAAAWFPGNLAIVQPGGNSQGSVLSVGTNDAYSFQLKANNVTSMTLLTNGNVGIGTTTPGATLDVKGHIANSGLAATVGTCGTSPAISGNDTRGIVTLGTGSPTACTVTFNVAYTTSPHCVITPYGGNPGAQWWITASTTTLVMNFSAAPTASQQFEYHCMQ